MRSTALAATGINEQISFQGKVVNADGTNVTNGSFNFLFCLYTTASPVTPCTAGADNDAVWRESKSLTVTDGIFQSNLGDTTTLPGSVDFNTDNIYLGINFNSDGQMTPLVRFTAAPYALNAAKVGGLTVTDTTGTLTIPNSETISFGGSFSTTASNDVALTTSGATTLTLPTTGTLATLAGTEVLTNKTIGSTGLTFSGAATDITTASGESLVIVASGAGVVDIQDATTVDSLTADTGGVSIAAGQSYTGAGAVTLSSGGVAALTLDSASGRVVVATGDYLSLSVSGVSGAAAGDIWYDSAANKYKINENGVTKILCNTTDLGCGSGGVTADSLDFIDFEDQLDLDVSTDILADGTEVFSLTNSGTGNSFLVNDASGDTTPFVIDNAGNIAVGHTTSNNARLYVNGDTTGTTLISAGFTSSTARTGIIGANINISNNVTGSNDTVNTGIQAVIPGSTNSNTAEAYGLRVTTGGAISQSSGGKVASFYGVNVANPNITGTSVDTSATATGLYVTTGSITTVGTQSGVSIIASGVGAGTLYGVNIGGITAGAGSETAINIGSGWDTILDTASLDITGAGAITGATGITSSGTITLSGLSTAGIVTNTAGGVLGTVASVPIANGGTNATTIGSAGSIAYSTGTAYAFSAVGTAGQAIVSGGTGAPTFFAPTAGSILFAGTSGILEQDNANFFYDNATNRLGLGTATPSSMLDILGASNALRLSYDVSNYATLSTASDGTLSLASSNVSESQFIIGTGASVDDSIAFDGASQDYYAGLDHTSGYFTIGTGFTVGSSTLFAIDSTGNVGIGTGVTAPAARLDLALASTNTTGATEYGQRNIISDTGIVTTGTDTTYGNSISVTRTGATGGTIDIYGQYISVTADNAVAGTSTAYGMYSTVSGADTNYAGIFMGGNVGVGDATPDSPFEIVSTSQQLRLSYTDGSVDGVVFVDSNEYLTLQAGTTGEINRVQVGAGGVGNTTPDLLGLDVKSDTGDPAGGFEGAIYYNTFDNVFRCYQGAGWTNCIGSGGASDLQTAYGTDADGSNVTISLTADDDGLVFTNPSSGGNDLSSFVLQVSQQNTTAAIAVLDLVQSSNAANGVNVTANSIDSETGLAITTNGLTSGKGLSVTSSATAFTGDLAGISFTGSNVNNTGNVFAVSNTGALNTNVSLFVDHQATGTNNLAVRVNDVSGDTTPFVIDGTGNVGIGTTAPARILDIVQAASAPQLRLSKDLTNYSEMTVDSAGDLLIGATGSDIRALSENVWVCDNDACPALTLTGDGNIFVENVIKFGNGVYMKNDSATELGVYDNDDQAMLIFDEL